MAKFGLSSLKAFAGRNKKGLAIGGGVGGGIVAIIIAAFVLLIPLKLIHIKENLTSFFERRHRNAIVRRIGKHYKVVFDKEGSIRGYKKRITGPNGSIVNLVANYKTDRLIKDLELRGIKAEFDSRGKLVKFGGEDVTDLKLSDQRSAVRTKLSEIYPETGSWRLGRRARRVYGFYGIKFRFFEGLRSKIGDKEAELNEKVRKKLRGSVVSGSGDVNTRIAGADPEEPGISEEERARRRAARSNAEGFGKKITDAASEQRQKLLAGERIKLDLGEAAEKAAKGAATGGLKAALLGTISKLSDLCTVRQLLVAIEVGAKALRAAPLARWAGIVLSTGDDLKAGKLKDGRVLNTFMKNFDGFEKSGAWKRISGLDSNANIKNAAKYKINGGLVGPLGELNDKVNAAGVPKKACGIVGNVVVQGAGAVVSLLGGIFSGGTTKVGEVAFGALVGVIQGLAVAIAEPIAINMLAGGTLTGDEAPDDLADAMVAGTDVLTNSIGRVSGEPRLSDEQARLIDERLAAEERTEYSKVGLLKRLFDYNDHRSFLAKIAMSLPSSVNTAASSAGQSIASINPFNSALFSEKVKTLALNLTGKAVADSQEEMFGVEQYGFSNDQLDRYGDILANEEFIMGNPERKKRYEAYVKKCLEPESDIGEEGIESQACQSPNSEQFRFRLYHFDLGIMDSLASYADRGEAVGVTP